MTIGVVMTGSGLRSVDGVSHAVSSSVSPVTSPGMCVTDVIEYYYGSTSVTVSELSAKSAVPAVTGSHVRCSSDGALLGDSALWLLSDGGDVSIVTPSL